MSAIVEQKPAEGQNMPAPLLRTLTVCDLVDSTALTQSLGDRPAAELMHKLDRLTRDLLYGHAGREIDKTDGFLVMFERPIQAVAFALAYQRLLRDMQEHEHVPLQARIGIHVGDVVLWENSMDDVARGAKAIEVEGLVKPVAARLMSLALPGQILLSGIAYTFALRAQNELGQERQPPEWRAHGRYLFKGVAEPMTVYEVGEKGIAPLARPAYSGKAHREVPWWRRPGMLALEAAVLVAAIAVPAYVFLRSPPAIAFADRDWVVVGDLNNLTGESTFNDSVQSAFRIGLEQSRYVNVLSDLKVRDTLALMQRDADTHVDRAVGSEVAIREGARALILPTLAEIGGRVRFTVEVVDPHTQATVYTESADGSGADSVLPSLDQVDQKLRVRLGEALAVVSKESMPLDRVTTPKLDALRAFALAQKSYDTGNYSESIGLYKEALKLDPAFAVAHINLARSLRAVDQREPALKELDLALGLRDRMRPRDTLYAEAWRASLAGPPRAALEKLGLLAKLYPDFFTGQSLFAYFTFEFANQSDGDVVAAAERAASPKNPHPQNNDVLLGLLYLSNEQYDRAAEKFAAIKRRSPERQFIAAYLFAARREFDKARAAIAETSLSDAASTNIERYILRIAIAFDSGQNEAAWKLLTEAHAKAATDDARFVPIYTGIELSLRVLESPSEQLKAQLSLYAQNAEKALAEVGAVDRSEIQFQILLGAYLTARLGDFKQANAMLAMTGSEPASGDYPTLGKMLAAAKAESQRAEGNPDAAISLLKPTLDGSELYIAHAVLMDAYVAKNDAASALAEAHWLTLHRGRGYAEPSMSQMLVPLNAGFSGIAQRFVDKLASAR